MNKEQKKAFTLIELLVVIAIIAMLLSILMPALNAVKKQSQRIVCMSNLAQWGLVFTLYTEDHDGHFFAGEYAYADPNGVMIENSESDLWLYATESYYQVPKLKFCPAASTTYSGRYKSRSSWGGMDDEVFSGSYGLNGWVCDPPVEAIEAQGHSASDYWRTMNVYSAGRVPLMADAIWFTGRPESSDLPPENEGEYNEYNLRSGTQVDDDQEIVEDENHMQRFCVDRHKEKLNVLFMDGMVESVSPKELWRLKWYKNYDVRGPLPEWPEWMRSFKEPN